MVLEGTHSEKIFLLVDILSCDSALIRLEFYIFQLVFRKSFGPSAALARDHDIFHIRQSPTDSHLIGFNICFLRQVVLKNMCDFIHFNYETVHSGANIQIKPAKQNSSII